MEHGYRNQGVALIVALGLISIFAVLGMAYLGAVRSAGTSTRVSNLEARADALAHSGMEVALQMDLLPRKRDVRKKDRRNWKDVFRKEGYRGQLPPSISGGKDLYEIYARDNNEKINVNSLSPRIGPMIDHLYRELTGRGEAPGTEAIIGAPEHRSVQRIHTGQNERRVYRDSIRPFIELSLETLRIEGGYPSLKEVRDRLVSSYGPEKGKRIFRVLSPHLTVHQWTWMDQTVLRPRAMRLNEEGKQSVDPYEPRAPINVNRAPEPVLTAVIQGIQGKVREVKGVPANGKHPRKTQGEEWSTRILPDPVREPDGIPVRLARRIARKIRSYVRGNIGVQFQKEGRTETGPFDTWWEFATFVRQHVIGMNVHSPGVDLNNDGSLDPGVGYVLLANFCPYPRRSGRNPDRNEGWFWFTPPIKSDSTGEAVPRYATIDKSALLNYTTEFSLHRGGYTEISARGWVLDQTGMKKAQAEIEALVRTHQVQKKRASGKRARFRPGRTHHLRNDPLVRIQNRFIGTSQNPVRKRPEPKSGGLEWDQGQVEFWYKPRRPIASVDLNDNGNVDDRRDFHAASPRTFFSAWFASNAREHPVPLVSPWLTGGDISGRNVRKAPAEVRMDLSEGAEMVLGPFSRGKSGWDHGEDPHNPIQEPNRTASMRPDFTLDQLGNRSGLHVELNFLPSGTTEGASSNPDETGAGEWRLSVGWKSVFATSDKKHGEPFDHSTEPWDERNRSSESPLLRGLVQTRLPLDSSYLTEREKRKLRPRPGKWNHIRLEWLETTVSDPQLQFLYDVQDGNVRTKHLDVQMIVGNLWVNGVKAPVQERRYYCGNYHRSTDRFHLASTLHVDREQGGTIDWYPLVVRWNRIPSGGMIFGGRMGSGGNRNDAPQGPSREIDGTMDGVSVFRNIHRRQEGTVQRPVPAPPQPVKMQFQVPDEGGAGDGRVLHTQFPPRTRYDGTSFTAERSPYIRIGKKSVEHQGNRGEQGVSSEVRELETPNEFWLGEPVSLSKFNHASEKNDLELVGESVFPAFASRTDQPILEGMTIIYPVEKGERILWLQQP